MFQECPLFPLFSNHITYQHPPIQFTVHWHKEKLRILLSVLVLIADLARKFPEQHRKICRQVCSFKQLLNLNVFHLFCALMHTQNKKKIHKYFSLRISFAFLFACLCLQLIFRYRTFSIAYICERFCFFFFDFCVASLLFFCSALCGVATKCNFNANDNILFLRNRLWMFLNALSIG